MNRKTRSTHRRILIASASGDYAQLLRHSIEYSSWGICPADDGRHLEYHVVFDALEVDQSVRYSIAFLDVSIGWRYCVGCCIDLKCSHFYILYDDEEELVRIKENLADRKNVRYIPKNPMKKMMKDILKHDIFKNRRK